VLLRPTDKAAGVVPEPGFTFSKGAEAIALNASAAPLVPERNTVCRGGRLAPCWILNVRLAGLTTIEVLVLVPFTVKVKLLDEERPHASFTVSTKEEVPDRVGVPAIENPLAAFTNLSPAGSVPELRVKVGTGEKGLEHPPELVRSCLYAWPITPLGKLPLVTMGPADSVTTAKEKFCVRTVPAASLTEAVML